MYTQKRCSNKGLEQEGLEANEVTYIVRGIVVCENACCESGNYGTCPG